MNDFFAITVLGIIEGITEFLPISSTGHLIVAADLLGIQDRSGTLEISIQLGAVLAVVWHYRRDLGVQLTHLPSSPPLRRLVWSLGLAFLPAAVLGVLFSDSIVGQLFGPVPVAVALIGGGIVLYLLERCLLPVQTRTLEAVLPRQALLIGMIQGLALIPGVSRSASSIVGGRLAGLDRPTATAFSFYLAIPTLGAATGYALIKHLIGGAALPWGAVLWGMAVSFVTALGAIGWLLRFVATHDFRPFTMYRILAGALLLAWGLGR